MGTLYHRHNRPVCVITTSKDQQHSNSEWVSESSSRSSSVRSLESSMPACDVLVEIVGKCGGCDLRSLDDGSVTLSCEADLIRCRSPLSATKCQHQRPFKLSVKRRSALWKSRCGSCTYLAYSVDCYRGSVCKGGPWPHPYQRVSH